MDHAVRVAAYCGTMRDFQKLVVKRVMTAALADSVQHKREKVREKIKEKAGEARASLNEKIERVNETRAGEWILAVAFAGFGVPASRYFWHAPLVAAARRDVQPRSLAQTATFGRYFLHLLMH